MSRLPVYTKPRHKHKFVVVNIFSRRKLLMFFAFVLTILTIFILIMKFLVSPIILKTGKSKIDEMSTKAINESINEVMLGTVSYDDLIHIVTDGSGKITMLQANSIIINTLTQAVVKETYNSLFNRIYDPLYIPLGSFSGIPAFSNWGPIISIDISPYGNVNCKFISEFKSGGINQTIHKIYALVETKVSVVLPLNKLVCENTAEVLICESLIIGDVPDTYLMAEEKGDLLNMAG